MDVAEGEDIERELQNEARDIPAVRRGRPQSTALGIPARHFQVRD